MKKSNIKFLVVFVIGFFTLLCIEISGAADFCVSTSVEFANALMTAESNGEDDTIRISQGTYTGIFIYSSAESHSLTIEGGYLLGCASRAADPTNTVLDAGNQWSALELTSTGTSDFTVDGLTLRNGSAKQDKGGGLYANTPHGEVTLNNNIINGNSATGRNQGGIMYNGYGGGVYVHSTSATFTNNIISGNSARGANGGVNTDGYGGGVYLYVLSATLLNNIISGNSAKGTSGCSTSFGLGGGIYLRGCSGSFLSNNTICGNSVGRGDLNPSRGGGLYIRLVDNSNYADIYNNIIWGNSGDRGADIYIINDGNNDNIRSTVNLLYNNFNHTIPSGLHIQKAFFIDPSNLNDYDPLFEDASNDDYHLLEGSPCIDTGIPDTTGLNLPLEDFDGNKRIWDGDKNGSAIIDIGALEYGASSVPVELASFFTRMLGNIARLEWVTASESNNYGFEVERLLANDREKIGFVQGNGTTTEPHHYEFVDYLSNIPSGVSRISYRLRQIDTDGSYEYSNDVTINLNHVPKTTELSQNYPNPFNPSTEISYSIAKPSFVILKIYDILGREIQTLVNEFKDAGTYSLKFEAAYLTGSIYFCKFQAGDFVEVKKMILVQ